MALPPDPIIVQPATTAWAEAMAAVHGAAFPPAEAWDAAAFRTQLGMPNVIGLVHPAGGLILVRIAADEAEVLTLAVAPAVRHRGLGRELLREAIQRLATRGARTLFLEVSTQNLPALALYQKAGFVESGRRRRYYPDGTDAFVLRRPLDPASSACPGVVI